MEDLGNPDILEKYGNDLMSTIIKGPILLNEFKRNEATINSKMIEQNNSTSKTKDSNTKHPQLNKPKSRIDKLLHRYNNEFISQAKEADLMKKNRSEIQSEYEKLTSEINKVKTTNRDEELLKMQKKNQEIEIELFDLKNQDKTKLIDKEEESKKLVQELNDLFQIKMNDALVKDKERKSAIEEIKNIKKQQEDLNAQIAENINKLNDLDKDVKNLEEQVNNYETYKQFIDKVIEKSNEGNSNNHNDYDKLKEKFENLIERMNEIKDDIEKQEVEIKEKKAEQARLMKTDEKQNQNQKVLKLEEEAKELARENELLEKEIEEIMKKNQKKESDNHQIMLSIINLYKKVEKKKDKEIQFDTENMKESQLCEMLSEINDKLNDLIAIYKDLESYNK